MQRRSPRGGGSGGGRPSRGKPSGESKPNPPPSKPNPDSSKPPPSKGNEGNGQGSGNTAQEPGPKKTGIVTTSLKPEKSDGGSAKLSDLLKKVHDGFSPTAQQCFDFVVPGRKKVIPLGDGLVMLEQDLPLQKRYLSTLGRRDADGCWASHKNGRSSYSNKEFDGAVWQPGCQKGWNHSLVQKAEDKSGQEKFDELEKKARDEMPKLMNCKRKVDAYNELRPMQGFGSGAEGAALGNAISRFSFGKEMDDACSDDLYSKAGKLDCYKK